MSKTPPLVSVIVPIYNMEAFLPETVNSILASDYPAFEVILIDDGSTDASYALAQRFAATDSRVRAYTQPNAGVIATRNHAIALARGEYILPVDADDLIAPTYIKHAVEAITGDPDVKVVYPRAEFFGARTGEWRLPPFSLRLLARKNIICACALYRKADWERVGGYCEEIIAREDWEFWISLLKEGGKALQLPGIEFFYRIREGSKRTSDRKLKRHVVSVLNRCHPEFFHRELGGPLRLQRSASKWFNRLCRILFPRYLEVTPAFANLKDKIATLPESFAHGGTVLYKGRNELKEFAWDGQPVVVKSYQIPHLLNRFIYRFFRPSKAERSFRYAKLLSKAGIGTPIPIGYCQENSWLLLGHSYYVSLRSTCPHTYRDFATSEFNRRDEILRAIARTTARMHEHGFLHKDYSAGNILFQEEANGIRVEIVDLNRMRFKQIDVYEGCQNFERLPGTPDMLAVLAEEYAQARGFDPDLCKRLLIESHKLEQR